MELIKKENTETINQAYLAATTGNIICLDISLKKVDQVVLGDTVYFQWGWTIYKIDLRGEKQEFITLALGDEWFDCMGGLVISNAKNKSLVFVDENKVRTEMPNAEKFFAWSFIGFHRVTKDVDFHASSKGLVVMDDNSFHLIAGEIASTDFFFCPDTSMQKNDELGPYGPAYGSIDWDICYGDKIIVHCYGKEDKMDEFLLLDKNEQKNLGKHKTKDWACGDLGLFISKKNGLYRIHESGEEEFIGRFPNEPERWGIGPLGIYSLDENIQILVYKE